MVKCRVFRESVYIQYRKLEDFHYGKHDKEQ